MQPITTNSATAIAGAMAPRRFVPIDGRFLDWGVIFDYRVGGSSIYLFRLDQNFEPAGP